MGFTTDDFPEQVKERIDIVEVVSEYVDLKRSGKNYKGLCPFHQENTPSFTVNPDNQFYYCFGCNTGGDVFNFMMEIENITFRESLKQLADRAGLEMPGRSKGQKRINKKREKLFQINKLTARYYHYLLSKKKVGEKARRYLADRGYTNGDIEEFHLGFAPDSWRALLKFLQRKGYAEKELLAAGLVLKSNKGTFYDRFRNRIIFPIFNIRDEVLAFGARTIETGERDTPKYINSPETLIYKKGTTLYGINWARDSIRSTEEAIIMEGYTDVLTARKEGLENVVASLGTALTSSQARLLNRYASTAYIAYDADAAGARATMRGLDILKQAGLKVKVIQLNEEEDPDDYIREHGQQAFLQKRNQALNLGDYKLKQTIGDKDLADPEKKIETAQKVVEMLVSISDPVEREIYLQKAAEKLDIAPDVLKEKMSGYNKKDKNYKNSYTKNNNKTNLPGSINILEEKILQAIINNKSLRRQFSNRLKPQYFDTRWSRVIKVLRNNIDIDINSILENIEEKETKKRLMALTVAEKKPVDNSILDGWLTALMERKEYQRKAEILKKLEEGKMSLPNLNKLLISFQRLSANRKGGI
ncbi:MAG: DNA primase [Halanaerobiaceae bacterium]